jgi:hypothetical protein
LCTLYVKEIAVEADRQMYRSQGILGTVYPKFQERRAVPLRPFLREGYFWTSDLLGLLSQSHDVAGRLHDVAGRLVCTVLLLGNITLCKPFDTRPLLVGLRNLLRSLSVRRPKAGSEKRMGIVILALVWVLGCDGMTETERRSGWSSGGKGHKGVKGAARLFSDLGRKPVLDAGIIYVYRYYLHVYIHTYDKLFYFAHPSAPSVHRTLSYSNITHPPSWQVILSPLAPRCNHNADGSHDHWQPLVPEGL